MRNLEDIELEREENDLFWRIIFGIKNMIDYKFPLENGVFCTRCAGGYDEIWEHIGLDFENQKRCPTHKEMCQLKQYFFLEHEVVFQVHPAKSEYVNHKEYMLHLWRNRGITAMGEERLRRKIRKTYEEAKKYFSGERKEVFLEDSQLLIVFCGQEWLSWEEICKIKQRYWEPEEAAVQFNVSWELDCNEEHMILLWDATDFDLPSKDLV